MPHLPMEMLIGLLTLFVVSFLGSSFLPLPVTITIIYLGQFHFPVWVVLVGTAGTVAGWLAMRGFFGKMLARKPALAERIPASYQRFFLRHTGFWLFVSNALPFPVDFMRILAFVNGYNPRRMVILIGLGRLVRNALLVWLGRSVAAHPILFWLVMLLFLLLPPILEFLLPRIRRVGRSESVS